jgi:hypothetical protein
VSAADSKESGRELPPYLVLLRVGFALPATLLPRRCALTAPFHPYPGVAVEAVCFLWHFPSSGLESTLPDVIRHTALRSSDFPPSASEDAESDRPVRLPTESLYAVDHNSESGSDHDLFLAGVRSMHIRVRERRPRNRSQAAVALIDGKTEHSVGPLAS